jgi:hypothetical protein
MKTKIKTNNKIFRAIMVELETCLKFREEAKKWRTQTELLEYLLSRV